MGQENDLIRLRRAFHIPEAVTIIPFAKLNLTRTPTKKHDEDFKIDNTDTRDKPIGVSPLNTYIYADIQFSGARWETATKGIFKSFDDQKYSCVLIQLNRPKIIEKTEVQGRTGTVKEYITDGDYVVQVDGIIDGKNGNYPIDEVAALRKMIDAPIPIDVSSVHLLNLGIVSLVLTDHSFPQEQGSYSSQAFSLTFLSDIPIELRISDKDVL